MPREDPEGKKMVEKEEKVKLVKVKIEQLLKRKYERESMSSLSK